MKTTNRFATFALALVAAASLAATPAAAQDMGNSGNVSLSAGVDIVTDYYFRGIVQETGGFIAQPYLDGSISFGNASLTAGTWSSLHSVGDEGFSGAPQSFYETDFYAGVGVSAGMVGVDVTYTAYMSPRGSWGTTKELAFGLSIDDGYVSPYVTVAAELAGGADGYDTGNYLEFGIEPAAPLDDAPVSLSFPVAVGMSLSDYYEYESAPGIISDSGFGFFSVGASLGVPLAVPEQFGAWELALGINALVLGEGAKAIDGGDSSTKLIALFGLSLGY